MQKYKLPLLTCPHKKDLCYAQTKAYPPTHPKKKQILKFSFKFLILILVSFISKFTVGQNTISGKVFNELNGPFQYATIEIKKDSTFSETTTTDSLGDYKFSNIVASNYTIILSYLTYAKKEILITIKKDTTLNIEFSNPSQTLKEVIVTSKKPTFERRGDRFIFTPNKLLAEGSTAIEVMQHTPLLKYDANSDAFSIINKKSTIILLNNKKTILPKEMIIEMLKTLPAENIKSIEIITNPGSEFSANSTGGIININIKRQVYEGWLSTITLTTQQSKYNTSIFNGFASYRKGKFGLQIIPFINNSFNYNTKTNILNYTTGLSESIKSNYFRRYLVLGGGINLDYDINQNNFLSFKGFFSNVDGISNTSAVTNYNTSNLGNTDSIQTARANGKDKYTYNFGNINYFKKIDSLGKQNINVDIDYNQFAQKNINTGNFYSYDKHNVFIKETDKYKNNLPQNFFNLSERVEYNQQLNKSAKLSVGIQLSNTKVTNNLIYTNWNYNNNNYEINNILTNKYSYNENYYATFISINKNFGSKWSSTLGLRAEKTQYNTSNKNANISIDTNYLNLFPNLSLSYAHNQSNQFGISFSRKISRPNIEMLFPGRTYNTQNYFTENNPFLQPVIFYNGEFSYTLKNKHSFIFAYSIADNHYSNFTIPIIENNIPKLKSTYLNYGKASSIDFTINLNESFLKNIWECSFTPSFDYTIYKINNTILLPTNIKNFNYNIILDNTIYISKKKKWTAFLTFNLLSKYEDISERKTNTSSHLDIAIKKIITKNVSIFLSLNDIYNGSSVSNKFQKPNRIVYSNYQETNTYNQSFTVRIKYILGNRRVKQTKERNTANEELKGRASK